MALANNQKRMLNRFSAATISVFIAVVVVNAQPANELFTVFQSQFIAYFTRSTASVSNTQGHIDSQRADGSWGGINYNDEQFGGGWGPGRHLSRLQSMAEVYASSRSGLYKDADLRDAIVKGLEFWYVHDFSNRNWWWRRIGIPRRIAVALVLMRDDLPANIVRQARNTVLSDSKTSIDYRRYSTNLVWMAAIELKKGWIWEDKERMRYAAGVIFDQIKTTRREGMQPDYSFHMHQAQLQMGMYGMSLCTDQIDWINILDGTELQLPKEKMELLRTFILEGQCWFLWNNRYDLNAMGRQLTGQQGKGTTLRNVLRDMIPLDPEYASVYEARRQNQPAHDLTGSKMFWRSDIGVHRRPNWYTSVRMSSTRLIGGENTHGVNPNGRHCASGVLLVNLSGNEYSTGRWNWNRLPGTTTDQGITDLVPSPRSRMRGKSNFVGGIAEGPAGVATMIYELDGLNARKAWFFEENAIICLGAGINGTSLSDVYTSIEQSNRSETVASSNGNLTSVNTNLAAGGWVHHAGIGYKINNAANVFLPASPNTFSVWINHGKSPKNDSYSYTIYPQTMAGEMNSVIANHKTKVLSNTTTLQATEGAHGLHAVFYAAGNLTMSTGDVVSVGSPCVLSLRNKTLLVADPTRSLGSVDVTINGKKTTVKLPSGDRGGAQVSVPVDYTITITPPSVNIENAPDTVVDGGTLGITATASSPDGSISQLQLFVDGEFIRRERLVPYAWGAAATNDANKDEFAFMEGGKEYEIVVVATDNFDLQAADTIRVYVQNNTTSISIAADKYISIEKLSYRVYSDGSFKIQLPKNEQIQSFQIYRLDGKIVYSFTQADNTTINGFIYKDNNILSNGIYITRLKTDLNHYVKYLRLF